MPSPTLISMLVLTLMLCARPALCEPPRVVASIKPIHALASALMEGVATPQLLVRGSASPHGYALRPSEARALSQADLIFWVGEQLETFLPRTLKNLGTGTEALALIETSGLLLYSPRKGGAWEAGHKEHHEHVNHPGVDPHIWLSPANAAILTREMARRLVKIDAPNAERYKLNATKLLRRLEILDESLGARLKPLRNTPYLVFHDAYQYFERHYGLANQGSVTISPERRPGVRRISAIREKIKSSKARAVFSEPQFDAKIIPALIEGTGAQNELLDPLGMNAPEGAEAYFFIMEQMGESLHRVLFNPE